MLAAAYGDRFEKPRIDALLESVGIDGQLRAEQLNVDEILELCETIRTA